MAEKILSFLKSTEKEKMQKANGEIAGSEMNSNQPFAHLLAVNPSRS